MAILGTCNICNDTQAKYKCSKCPVQYCSLKCFKSPDHSHDEVLNVEEQEHQEASPKSSIPKSNDSKYQTLFNDEKFKYLLSFKSLQIHLGSIYEILQNPSLTQEKKLDQANEKLTSLRTTGQQENELVEEFCQHITHLLNQS